MNAILEKFGLTMNATLVTIMFLSYFAGYLTVPHIAIATFTALSVVIIAMIYKESA